MLNKPSMKKLEFGLLFNNLSNKIEVWNYSKTRPVHNIKGVIISIISRLISNHLALNLVDKFSSN